MRKWISAFTLIELLVVIAIIAILAGLLLPALSRAREESRRKACNSNMGQIVKACTTYQEPNGDFFPAFSQAYWNQDVGTPAPITVFVPTTLMMPNMINLGTIAGGPGGAGSDGTFQPMPSLAVLYPAYVDNVKIFGCPSTPDRPVIAVRYYNGARHTCFGFIPDAGETGTISNGNISGYPTGDWNSSNLLWTYNCDPAAFTGNEVVGSIKCSYLYDELTNFRDIGPGQAIASDADGQTWLTTTGKYPAYTTLAISQGAAATQNDQWARPKKSNHDNGQNVMYFDGHVKWVETVFASRDPNDNIYNPQVGWGGDTDAYLWDGTINDSRTANTQ
jgi:prepilin-type N-terminal cleavage/methylation domain-containing protein/prepilin-type processing-associated H-X9-DG protein